MKVLAELLSVILFVIVGYIAIWGLILIMIEFSFVAPLVLILGALFAFNLNSLV